MTANPYAKQLEFFDHCERSPVFRLLAEIDAMLSVADIKRDMLPEVVMCGGWSGCGPPFEYGQEGGWRDVEQATRVASALRDDDSSLPPLPAISNAATPGVALAAVRDWCVKPDHERDRESEREARGQDRGARAADDRGRAGGRGDGDGGREAAGGAARQTTGQEARARLQPVERGRRGPLAYRALPSGSWLGPWQLIA